MNDDPVARRVARMFASCTRQSRQTRTLSSTLIYNEGWMLRLVLDWYARKRAHRDHRLCFAPSTRWFSEPLLPTPFRPGGKGKYQGEAWTHADGVIGNFSIGHEGRSTDLRLTKGAKQLVVLEAKMYSELSVGVTHAPKYDQAARTVACMAQVVLDACGAKKALPDLSLGFYVLAPEEQILRGVFEPKMTKRSIWAKVQQRVDSYNGRMGKSAWRAGFRDVLDRCEVGCLAWEDVVKAIGESGENAGRELHVFYTRCVHYNRPRGRGKTKPGQGRRRGEPVSLLRARRSDDGSC